MNGDIEHTREEIRATQQHIGETIAEIESRVRETKSTAAHRANPMTYAREHPWIALGLALGAGVALALTGADEAAASAAADRAKSLGRSAADAASAAREKVVDLVQRDPGEAADEAEGAAHVPTPAAERDLSGGLESTRVVREITGLLSEGLDEVLRGLGRQRPSAERRLAGF